MCSFQTHRYRHIQLAQWSWPVTTGCPHTDQSQGPPSQHEPVCGRQRKKHLPGGTLHNSWKVKTHDWEKEAGLTPSGGSVWCPWVQRCERCLCRWRHTGTMSHGWSWCWREKTKQTGRMIVISGCSHVDMFLLLLANIKICFEPIRHFDPDWECLKDLLKDAMMLMPAGGWSTLTLWSQHTHTHRHTDYPSLLEHVPVEGGWVSSSAQLHQLVSGCCVKQADKRSFARGRSCHTTRLVERHASDFTLMGIDGEGGRWCSRLGVG